MKCTPRLIATLCVALVLLGAPIGCGASVEGVPDGWGEPGSWERAWATVDSAPTFVDATAAPPPPLNPYWPMQPGTRWSYVAATADGTETIKVEVLRETRTVMDVECVIVRDTVRLDGEIIEDTYDWYATDSAGSVWYMGEDSTEYENGKPVSTAGSWEAGVDGAEPGIKVWAAPHVDGRPYYQEYFKGEAEDLGRDIALEDAIVTSFGTFDEVLVVEEWTPLDPGFVERKFYAPGVGTIREEMVRGGDEVVELTAFVTP